jgi:hypothetical protein
MTTVSGTHNNDPMVFIDHAKKKAKNCSGHHLALYYFFVKCKEHTRIDDHFVSSLPDEMKGTSTKPPLEVVAAAQRTPATASMISQK